MTFGNSGKSRCPAHGGNCVRSASCWACSTRWLRRTAVGRPDAEPELCETSAGCSGRTTR
nr:hypothetical protein [Tanacetum cinerariifolium]